MWLCGCGCGCRRGVWACVCVCVGPFFVSKVKKVSIAQEISFPKLPAEFLVFSSFFFEKIVKKKLWLVVSHPQPPVVTAPVYCGC